MKRALVLVVFTLALAARLQAADRGNKARPLPAASCADGTIYDDGKFENALAPGLFATRDDLVMLFDAPYYPAKLDKVCLAWMRAYRYTTISFDLHVWASDGQDGAPGTLLADIPGLVATKVPARRAKFYSYNLAGFEIVIDGPVYIGPSWNFFKGFGIFLATDYGPLTPRRRAFHSVGEPPSHAPSREFGVDDQPAFRAFGTRVKFSPP